jgi:hypothetical protein
MDVSRFWLQVKGTTDLKRYARKDGFAYSVPTPQALRWARSADPVFIVLWDVSSHIGFYAEATKAVEQWVTGSGAQITIRFKPENAFDTQAVGDLAWEARLRHYRSLLLHASEVDDPEDLDELRWSLGLRVSLGLDFLALIGVISMASDGAVSVPRITSEKILGLATQFEEDPDLDAGDADPIEAAVAIVVVMCAQETMGNVGLPGRVLSGSIEALLAFIDLVVVPRIRADGVDGVESEEPRSKWRLRSVD